MNSTQLLAALSSALLTLPIYAQTGSQTTPPNAAGDTSTIPPSKTGSGYDKTGAANDKTTTSSHDMAGHGDSNKMVLGFLHHSNKGEIEMANLAKQNGSSKQVKDFADRMIKDHQGADEKVLAFAKSHNVDLMASHHDMAGKHDKEMAAKSDRQIDERQSKAVGSGAGEYAHMSEGTGGAGMDHDGMKHMGEHKAAMEKLKGLKGADFDREFARVMVKDHQHVVDRLTQVRSRMTDTETQGFIDKLLPTLKEHLSMAQKLQGDLKA